MRRFAGMMLVGLVVVGGLGGQAEAGWGRGRVQGQPGSVLAPQGTPPGGQVVQAYRLASRVPGVPGIPGVAIKGMPRIPGVPGLPGVGSIPGLIGRFR